MMDEIDLHIIEKLTDDARMSFRKIAEELKIAPDTVINRYQKLQEKGLHGGCRTGWDSQGFCRFW